MLKGMSFAQCIIEQQSEHCLLCIVLCCRLIFAQAFQNFMTAEEDVSLLVDETGRR